MLKIFALCTDYSIFNNSFISLIKPIDTPPEPLFIKNKEHVKVYTDSQIASVTIIQKYYKKYMLKKAKKLASYIIGVHMYRYKIAKLKKELVTINKIGRKKIYLISF